PQLYWVLSANDFTLDINDPENPKIVCLANNPQKQQIYGAVLSLYVTRLIKLVNQKNKLKSSLIFDEFPTIFFNDIDSLIATARSNKVATCLGIQDFSQLKKDYGADQSSVIMNITGNIISGQVTGETSKFLSERFGKINQVKESISINRTDTSVSKSSQLDFAIPQSKIAGLSSGEFVGMVADDPTNKIKLKSFHSEIINNYELLNQETNAYKPLPLISNVTAQMVNENFRNVKKEVTEIIEMEIERILNTPGLEGMTKNK
ncbi:MAG TPA: TraM recognition domain-containing protein, partial [Bacteroidia bacterium]|nr:TraM recognition domain-containing protein [Bacteroidia bacterium]